MSLLSTYRKRRAARQLANLLNDHAWQLDYAEIRPMATRALTLTALHTLLGLGKDITLDCSEAVTLIFRLSGFRDPNGLGYDGYGYTGDILKLPHFDDWDEVHVGTLIVFEEGPGPAHVVMVTEPGGENPAVFSHGSHAHAAIWDLDTERRYHPGQTIVLCAVDDL